ncbi:FecR domain-containing protein [Candidatus Uhrbacteria bacterium]|nr:FecR domain-containing protein [Candidatus Uhrbacteria bacterium]
MPLRLLTIALFLLVMSLLVLERFSGPPTFPVTVVRVDQESNYHTGESLTRGEIVTTAEGYLEITIGEDTRIFLSKNTQIELQRLFEDEVVIKLTKGRIVVDTQADTPVRIRTNRTQHLVHKSSASFVNYDFLQTVHVFPLTDTVQTTIGDENLITPLPLAIYETEPLRYEAITMNLAASDAKDFYVWAGVLTDEVSLR